MWTIELELFQIGETSRGEKLAVWAGSPGPLGCGLFARRCIVTHGASSCQPIRVSASAPRDSDSSQGHGGLQNEKRGKGKVTAVPMRLVGSQQPVGDQSGPLHN